MFFLGFSFFMVAPLRQIKNGHQPAPLKGVDQCPQALRLGLWNGLLITIKNSIDLVITIMIINKIIMVSKGINSNMLQISFKE
ncbi:hypothetical protein, partial [Streptomyces sp. CHB9.2]|uniref:hypothetical protein n=1 Tax=Streptomyces sp. CHB9.2 TaxID=2841670 RepID=UPI0020954285